MSRSEGPRHGALQLDSGSPLAQSQIGSAHGKLGSDMTVEALVCGRDQRASVSSLLINLLSRELNDGGG